MIMEMLRAKTRSDALRCMLLCAALGVVGSFTLTAGASTTHAGEQLCTSRGRLAFVQHRGLADVRVHFVNSGEDVRLTFVTHPDEDGEWHVVERWADPAIRVFVEEHGGQGIIDIKLVDLGPGCR
jgi:hypothetical protein